MISHEHKCIFVHIPKTGGASIEKLIWPSPNQRNPEYLWSNKRFPQVNNYNSGGLQHLYAGNIRKEVGEKEFSAYYKFAFVRNPWDKMVSLYFYLKEREDLREIANLKKDYSFKEFLSAISKVKHVQWDPQYLFVFDNDSGDLLVDHLGTFENYESDLSAIIRRINVRSGNGKLSTLRIPSINVSGREHYSTYYDSESKEMVESMYERDITLFNYQFTRSDAERKISDYRKFQLADSELIPPRKFQIMNYQKKGFIRLGERYLEFFVYNMHLRDDEHILEIGSGNGRIARGLVSYFDKGTYLGLDIMEPFVKWCSDAYSKLANFRFEHIDVYNQYYNTKSKVLSKDYKFDIETNQFDLIYLTSVFTHMQRSGVENYMKEIVRMLRPGGRTLITFFIIDDATIELMRAGKSKRKFRKYDEVSFTSNKKVPSSAMGFSRQYLIDLYGRVGLEVEDVILGRWRDPGDPNMLGSLGQDRIIASKPME